MESFHFLLNSPEENLYISFLPGSSVISIVSDRPGRWGSASNMIKINLLPKTINEKIVLRNTAIIFAVLLVAVVAGGLTYTAQMRAKLAQVQAQEQEAKIRKDNVDKIKATVEEWKGKIPPIKAKIDFIDSVLKYNTAYPALYEKVAQWTYSKVQYTSLTCNGTDMAMTARARNLNDLGRYLLNMYRATDLFTEVTISGIPGYGQAQSGTDSMMAAAPASAMPMPTPSMTSAPMPAAGASLAGMGAIGVGVARQPGGAGSKWIDFTVNCKLKTPIAAPALPGAAGGAAPGGGAPGAMPGGTMGAPMPTPGGPTGPGAAAAG